jgi:hypothetical protein
MHGRFLLLVLIKFFLPTWDFVIGIQLMGFGLANEVKFTIFLIKLNQISSNLLWTHVTATESHATESQENEIPIFVSVM